MAASDGDVPDLVFLRGGGEMGARMRALDWSKTSLGAPEQWPQSLRTCVRVILTSRQPMFVWWGDDLVNLYNDAYKSIVGGKHPAALGEPASVVWREIWHHIVPRVTQAMSGDEGTYDEALLLIMERHGYKEETYYTFSYSPVPDDLGVARGILCANTDDTRRIVGERRVALLRNIAARTVDARTVREACTSIAAALDGSLDFPLAILYLVDATRRSVELAGSSGIDRAHSSAAATAWPIDDALRANAPLVVDLAGRDGLPSGSWPEPPARAVAVPITATGTSTCTAVLVLGVNPYRPYDDDLRGYLALLAGQLAATLANADAYESANERAEQLAAIDRAKTAFFSNISHEFRTPLTLMLGPTEDALAREAPSLEGEDLRAVHRNELRLLKLVNALLDFSRIEAGRARASYVPTSLGALTRDLASTFRAAVERAGLAFVVDCAELGEPVYVDRDMWEKIVLNLLSNALKFTFDGSITVRVQGFTDHVELVVSDTGVGVPEADVPRLFQRFHRAQNTRARTHEGSGIGLALVSELVKLHGGSVRVASKVDEGTTFTVSLPLGNAHLPAEHVHLDATMADAGSGSNTARAFVEEALRWLPDAERETIGHDDAGLLSEHEPASQTIAVVDDNADMRDYLARLLRRRWQVKTFADGSEALAAIRREAPDLVLTDVMMPVLDGFGLLRALRNDRTTRALPVIMLSARAGDEASVEGLEAGADDYLVKPFSGRELIARVATHLQIAGLRSAAENASRAKDEFLSTLSHELRTPLNAIVGWAHLLRDGSVPRERVSHALETIERNARVQARLIEDLLDLSRIEQGKLVLNVAPVEMVRVVEAALDAVRPAFDAKGVSLERVLDSRATTIGDSDRLQQIVWNLLSNAVKFTSKGGRVRIALQRTSSYVELVVSDNGQGIDGRFLPHVFERFRQGDPSIVRRTGGLGLGLAIVRSLVELHGGTVTAASAGVDQGAEFVVRLPTAPLHVGRAAPPPGVRTFESPPGLAGTRVLVLDDEPQTRDLLSFVLEQCKVHVSTAASVEEAMTLLHRERFDLVVSDIGMPNEDGYGFVERLRKLPEAEGGNMPAVALTAYARGEDRTRALRAGFDMHMSKPIEPAELVVIVDRLLARHRRRES